MSKKNINLKSREEIKKEYAKYLFPDEWLLPMGMVVSRAGGYCVAVYRCKCGREQTAECPPFHSGISMNLAKKVGYEYKEGEWICPFCSGNSHKLDKIFNQSSGL